MNAQARYRVAQALLQEIDLTFQRAYHQSLDDVVQDLARHNLLRSVEPTPEALLNAIRESGILRLNASETVASMKTAVDRYALGTIEICARCGTMIDPDDLERHPASSFCARCRNLRF